MSAPAPRTSSRPRCQIDGGDDARVLLQPDRVLDLQDQRVEVREGHRHALHRSRSSAAASRARWSSACCSTRRFPPYKMTVRDATAALLDAMEVPGGQSGGTPTAVPPFITFQLGRADLQGRVHVADVRVQALHARTGEPIRADVKLTLKQAGEPRQGPEPDHAREGRLRRAHASRTATRCPRSPTSAYGDATALAPDRRGQRRRQPAAPAPRQLARRCRELET